METPARNLRSSRDLGVTIFTVYVIVLAYAPISPIILPFVSAVFAVYVIVLTGLPPHLPPHPPLCEYWLADWLAHQERAQRHAGSAASRLLWLGALLTHPKGWWRPAQLETCPRSPPC